MLTLDLGEGILCLLPWCKNDTGTLKENEPDHVDEVTGIGCAGEAQSPERQAIERCAFGTGAVGGEHIDDSILQPREYRTRCASPG